MQPIVPRETTVTRPRLSGHDARCECVPNPSCKAAQGQSAVGVGQLLPGQWEGGAGAEGAGVGIRKDVPGIFDGGRESSKTHRPQE